MSTSIRSIVPLLALLSSSVAVAQSSGFQDGELIMFAPTVPDPVGSGSSGVKILRIDPTDGTTSVLLDLHSTWASRDKIAYDPYRERVVLYGRFPNASDPMQIYLLDGFGATTALGYIGEHPQAFAPAAGGRIYFLAEDATRIHYFDSANQPHVLMDASGTQPFEASGQGSNVLHYDATLNALFLATKGIADWNCAGPTSSITIKRIGLSADGSQVLGPLGCTEVSVNPTGSSAPVGLSHHSSGSLLMVASTSPGGHPRMSLIHPRTLAVTPFTLSDHPQGATEHAGTYSTLIDRVVTHDTLGDRLLSYAFGQTGVGTTIPTSMPVSHPGFSGDPSTLIEVRPGGCRNLASTYCAAKVTAAGCVPAISGVGAASASAATGFTIRADNITPNTIALLFLGYSGISAIPYQGGTLCTQPPLIRSAILQSGGAGTCTGVLEFDFNAYLASTSSTLIGAGSVVHAQFIFRDPGHPIGGIGLTDALRFTVCP